LRGSPAKHDASLDEIEKVAFEDVEDVYQNFHHTAINYFAIAFDNFHNHAHCQFNKF